MLLQAQMVAEALPRREAEGARQEDALCAHSSFLPSPPPSLPFSFFLRRVARQKMKAK